MTPRRLLVMAATTAALLPGIALPQEPSTPKPARGQAAQPARAESEASQARPARRISYSELPPPHSSILRVKPWHEDFVPEEHRVYGYRNPGGVGRMAEYYPPDNKFQNDSPRRVTARIGLGGQPDRNEQLRSQSVGTAYYGMLQQHIDAYGSPRFGFGFGFGW